VDERKREGGLDHRDNFERLYEESFLRKFRMAELKNSIMTDEAQCLFQPELNPTSKMIVDANHGNVGFYERMQKFALEKMEQGKLAQLDDSVYIDGERKRLNF
jgi:hypothetical protein